MSVGNRSFRNIKYLITKDCSKKSYFSKFNESTNGVILNSKDDFNFCVESIESGAKVVLLDFGLGGGSHFDDHTLKTLRIQLNEIEGILDAHKGGDSDL